MCPTCAEDVERVHGTKRSVVHCESDGIGFGVRLFSCGTVKGRCHTGAFIHHGNRAYYCPFCNSYLGCSWCLPIGVPTCTKCRRDIDGGRIMSEDQAIEAMHLLRKTAFNLITPEDALEMFNATKGSR